MKNLNLRLAAVAALSMLSMAAPASAVTFVYDAFTSFDGTQGAGNFYYGTYDVTTDVFTQFAAPSGCALILSSTICLNDGSLPAAFKTSVGVGAHTDGSVNIPGDALLLHPGNDATQAAAVLFKATVSGWYTLDLHAFVTDNSPSGVNIIGLQDPYDPVLLTNLNSSNPSIAGSFSGFYLNVDDTIGFAVDYDGVYNNDSTGLNMTMTVTPVPEPTMWAMMVLGFGVVGGAIRRSRAVAKLA